MPQIFISYRRKDSESVTGHIYDHMVRQFGKQNVFLDKLGIPLGVNYEDYIVKKIPECDVVLVVIGPDWVPLMSERAKESKDLHRFEVEIALKTVEHVIPVLVEKAEMPREDEVPESIIDLCKRESIEVRPYPDFERHCESLADGIRQALEAESTEEELSEPPEELREKPSEEPLVKSYSELVIDLPLSTTQEGISDDELIKIFQTIHEFSQRPEEISYNLPGIRVNLIFNRIFTVQELRALVSSPSLGTLRELYCSELGRRIDPVAVASWGSLLFKRGVATAREAVQNGIRGSLEYRRKDTFRRARVLLTEPVASELQIRSVHSLETYSRYNREIVEILLEAIDFQVTSGHGRGAVQVEIANMIGRMAEPGDSRVLIKLLDLYEVSHGDPPVARAVRNAMTDLRSRS